MLRTYTLQLGVTEYVHGFDHCVLHIPAMKSWPQNAPHCPQHARRLIFSHTKMGAHNFMYRAVFIYIWLEQNYKQ